MSCSEISCFSFFWFLLNLLPAVCPPAPGSTVLIRFLLRFLNLSSEELAIGVFSFSLGKSILPTIVGPDSFCLSIRIVSIFSGSFVSGFSSTDFTSFISSLSSSFTEDSSGFFFSGLVFLVYRV
jgi:hypothetical protein